MPAKSEDFGEPWVLAEWEIVDRNEEVVIFWDSHVDHGHKARIVACVNFCQHLSTETLEALAKERVGAATLVQWIRRCNTWDPEEEFGSSVCAHCEHVVSSAQPHAEDCLLKRTFDITGKDV